MQQHKVWDLSILVPVRLLLNPKIGPVTQAKN